MKNTDFKKGEFVVVISPCQISDVNFYFGALAKVVHIDDDTHPDALGIEFVNYKFDGHSCNNHGRNGKCWYFFKKNIENNLVKLNKLGDDNE